MPRIAARHLSSLVFASGLHDFFNSGTWQVIRNLALLLVVIFWAATAYWVYKDARRRIEDPAESLRHARAFGEPVLVTGSLYLLADLAKDESVRWRTLATG